MYRSSKAGGAEVEILEDQIKSCKAQTMDEGMSDRGSSLGIVSVHTCRSLEPGNVCFLFTEIVLQKRRERNRDKDNNICE